MKHAAEVLSNPPIYCYEQTTPSGTYHWAKSINRKPPTLTKITRINYKTLVKYSDGDQLQFGYEYTIWKHGWHHIKGARKKAQEKAKRA